MYITIMKLEDCKFRPISTEGAKLSFDWCERWANCPEGAKLFIGSPHTGTLDLVWLQGDIFRYITSRKSYED